MPVRLGAMISLARADHNFSALPTLSLFLFSDFSLCHTSRRDDVPPIQNERGVKTRDYKFRRGTTAWTKEDVRSLIASEEIKATTGAGKIQDPIQAAQGMDVDA